jgi:hypothetical protein
MSRPKVTKTDASARTSTARAGGAYVPDVAVRLCGALLALAIAAAHVADQGGITAMADPSWIGWGYRLIEVGGVLTALILLLPWRSLLSRAGLPPVSAGIGWASGVLLGIAPFVSYLLTRSVGLPGDSGDVGNWGDWLGTLSLFVEAAMVTLSVAVLLAIWQSTRSASAAALNGQPRLGTARQPAARTKSDA